MIKTVLKKLFSVTANDDTRNRWLTATVMALPKGGRILDAGAGQLRNKTLCSHLKYVSQDICQYDGTGDTKGLHSGKWDTSRIDIVSDIANIPEDDASFDAILCSEVLEHVRDPLKALDEFSRLLKPGGKLILTVPFASNVHLAPYFYSTGFSRYWYEEHFPSRHLKIEELTPNGDWFSFVRQEVFRLPSMARRYGDWCWPLAYMVAGCALLYFSLRPKRIVADDLACFGWHCVAVKD